MLPAHEKIDATIFDVEKNDGLARQIFHAYYRTPDASGEIYKTFPAFFLVKTTLLDNALLALNKQEMPLIESCKRLAELRAGYLGITQYFDKKFSYHWIKYAVYPYMLGDADAEYQDEFFYLLNQFVLFTQQNPTIYGDLTADANTDNDVALMLAAIRHNAANMEQKLQHYPAEMLLSFNVNWPTSQLKTLLASLEINKQSWNHLFLEHLRYVMRKNKGLAKPSPSSFAVMPDTSAPNSSPTSESHTLLSDNLTASKALLGEPALHPEAPQFDYSATMDNIAEKFNVLDFVVEEKILPDTAMPVIDRVAHVLESPSKHARTALMVQDGWAARWIVNLFKGLSVAALILASALAGFLFANIEHSKISQIDEGLIRSAGLPASAINVVEENSDLIVLENLQMSQQLTIEKR